MFQRECELKKSILSILLLGLFFIHCGIFENDEEEVYRLEYEFSGGFAGILERTFVDEDGHCRFTYGSEYSIGYQLPTAAWDSLTSLFIDEGFFNLGDRYYPETPVADGINYRIKFYSNDQIKTVDAATGGNIPENLNRIIDALFDLNGRIRENPDVGTLSISNRYTLRLWPFSEDLRLSDSLGISVTYENDSLSREIFDFFVQQFQAGAHAPLFSEADSLYDIIVSGLSLSFEENIGNTFRIVRQYPERYWPASLGIDLHSITDCIVVSQDQYIAIRDYLRDDNEAFDIFILENLQDGEEAVQVRILGGQQTGGGG